ncbi:hypothetical protein GCM10023069_12780 [Shinella granuli]
MFGNGKRKGAAAKFRGIGLFVQTFENQFDLISRVRLGFQSFVEGTDNPFVAILKIGRDEMVFRREVSIERRLCDVRFLDDAIYADSTNAFAVEKRSGGCDDLV